MASVVLPEPGHAFDQIEAAARQSAIQDVVETGDAGLRDYRWIELRLDRSLPWHKFPHQRTRTTHPTGIGRFWASSGLYERLRTADLATFSDRREVRLGMADPLPAVAWNS